MDQVPDKELTATIKWKKRKKIPNVNLVKLKTKLWSNF